MKRMHNLWYFLLLNPKLKKGSLNFELDKAVEIFNYGEMEDFKELPNFTREFFKKNIKKYIQIKKGDDLTENMSIDIEKLANDMITEKPELLKDYSLDLNFNAKYSIAKDAMKAWIGNDKKVKIMTNDSALAKRIVEKNTP